jgi:hypothetical protein
MRAMIEAMNPKKIYLLGKMPVKALRGLKSKQNERKKVPNHTEGL